MSNYTSPSPASIGSNGNQVTWWIPAVNIGTTNATAVQVQVSVSPANGLQLITFAPPAGTTYNASTGVWTIGNLPKGEANRKWLRLVTSVADIGLAPFTVTSTISGNGIDPNALNNILVQTIDSVVCNPSAAANNDPNSCLCVDVSLNDEACTHGVTEWRIAAGTVTNSTDYVFDQTTGKGYFPQDDPTKDVTFNYNIFCDIGSGFLQTAGPATVTIPALIQDITPFNHTPDQINGVELTVAQLAVLQAQYPGLTEQQIKDFCWNVIKNGAGTVTGGWPFECNEKQDTRTFFECSTEECVTPVCPDCGTNAQGDLPLDVFTTIQAYTDYEPQVGDTIYVSHVAHNCVYKWNGSQWKKWPCGCQPKPVNVTDFTITGTTNKTATITLSNGTTLTATFDDIDTDTDTDTNTTYTLDDITTPGSIHLKDNTGAIVSTVVLPTVGGLDNWGTQVIQHAVGSISSGNGTTASPLLVEKCQSIDLFIPPFDTDVGAEAILNVSGINNTSPLWDTWQWQVAINYLPTPTPNPTWVNVQTGGLTYTIGTDDTIVRVVLTNGTCIYWSNESGYEHAFDVIECPIRLEALLGSNVDVFPVITGPNSIENKTYSMLPGYSPNAFTFQQLGNLAGGPSFTWTDVQIGEDPATDILKYVGGDGEFYRIKYTHTNGCIYYSNIVFTYYV